MRFSKLVDKCGGHNGVWNFGCDVSLYGASVNFAALEANQLIAATGTCQPLCWVQFFVAMNAPLFLFGHFKSVFFLIVGVHFFLPKVAEQ